ncbi:MarR family winged helix-turn-helix transcriptional regulator [Salininema proteolyticum]|uniref:MarR family winged helix-turn-helix transcriptional regulator n=1 Tax=Salininema proteolyticum TaxID=1607685 RepID=A0ABV8U4R1_9ACTN
MTGFDADEAKVQWCDLVNTYHRVSCALESELGEKHGLGLSDYSVLDMLGGACGVAGEKIPMKRIQEKLYLSQSAFSRAVTRLEKQGAVSRAACSTDRRSVFLTITPDGSRRLEEAAPTFKAVLESTLPEGRPA